jgi:hypothetical protein
MSEDRCLIVYDSAGETVSPSPPARINGAVSWTMVSKSPYPAPALMKSQTLPLSGSPDGSTMRTLAAMPTM